MKKVLPLILGLFLILPLNGVFAEIVESEKPNNYRNGLLDDENLIKNTTLSINHYDNNISTTSIFNSTGHSVIFNYPVDITSFYINLITNVSYPTTLKLNFFDGTSNEFTLPTGEVEGYYHELNYRNVESININYSGQQSSIREIDFFGSYESTDDFFDYLGVQNLIYDKTFNTVNFSWKNPEDLTNVIIKQNGIEVAELGAVQSYSINGLSPETTYNFEVIAKYSDGILSDPEKITVTTDEQPEDILSPDEITGFSASVTSFDATFAWVNPPDTDFKHVRIYRDGELIEPSHTLNTYNATGLVPNTTYVFKFVTVDANGNNSNGYIQSIKTNIELDNIAPDGVIGLSLYNGNKSGQIKWTANKENDLAFYNVYVNGVKHNESPILSTNYVINNIENDVTYEINVTAVDTSENESGFSSSVFLTPEEGSMPVFKASYDLKSVSDGTGNWFNTMWPILAFAVGLPLAFIVASRMKTLFFA